MLLFRKTVLMGAAIMTPVMANILMINIFFHITVGAECTAAFIFGSMLAILWRERAGFVDMFWSRQTAEPVNSVEFHRSMAALVVFGRHCRGSTCPALYQSKVSN